MSSLFMPVSSLTALSGVHGEVYGADGKIVISEEPFDPSHSSWIYRYRYATNKVRHRLRIIPSILAWNSETTMIIVKSIYPNSLDSFNNILDPLARSADILHAH